MAESCEHYWYVLPDDVDFRDADSLADALVKQPCGEAATGRMTWLGSHGHPDREIAVCDKCRESVEVQNLLQQAERDGTLRDLLFGDNND